MEPQSTASSGDRFKAWPQYLMPGHLLSLAMLQLTRVRQSGIKNRLIDWFVARFKIDMTQALESDPHAYPDFNSFFTRAINPELRPLAGDPAEIASPVDGTISQIGAITGDQIFQAKGHDFSLTHLLGGQESWAAPFRDGRFATIYLSPRDYHRIHMPVDGTLRSMVLVPGRLFSVNPATTRAVPGLFARNERVVAFFDSAFGPMAMVMVGAVFVAGIETVWHGMVTPPAGRVVRLWSYEGERARQFPKGEEIGRFNMGSTVILLFGTQAVHWEASLVNQSRVLMGQHLGRCPAQ